ncbi:unnamed protein product [Protopolystoma xenopodis]|uniref:Uncharacterized protein n=1 Tax=Protopolystoma xenopodis TaxID=117903 RepID=A0A448XN71_9PLAT|nr:unnamed protein product [Protopolystoma xenopodis]
MRRPFERQDILELPTGWWGILASPLTSARLTRLLLLGSDHSPGSFFPNAYRPAIRLAARREDGQGRTLVDS